MRFTVCGVVIFEEGAEIGKRKVSFDVFRLRCQAESKEEDNRTREGDKNRNGMRDENEWGQYAVDDTG